MTVLHIDFETRSTVDLKALGVDNYSKHASTDVWCMAWAFDDAEEPRIVAIAGAKEGDWLHEDVEQHVENGGIVVAHNAAFELAIWNNICMPRYGWPELKAEQCRDTMAMAYAMALPGSLDKASAAVGITQQKDAAGYRLMMQMCRPRVVDDAPCPKCRKTDCGCFTRVMWWDDADKLQRLYEYCRQDVRVERELDKRLMQLSASEQALWTLDHKINDRGVYVDREAVTRALAVVDQEQRRLNEEMKRVTGNFVGFCTETARLTKWVQAQGVVVGGVAKADVLDALDGPLPDAVRTALLLRQEAGKSSTAKLKVMLAAASEDGRLRGMLQFHGAGTGRWAGRKVQLHNLPRPQIPQDEIERAIDVLMRLDATKATRTLDAVFGSPMDILSWGLRGMLRAAPGHDLLAADFRNIEGRGLAWLAGEEWKIDAFKAYDAGTGPDLYLVAASGAYHKPIEECYPHRQVGKVLELSAGFGGGLGAIRRMEKALGIKLGLGDAEIQERKDGWRNTNSRIAQLWYDYEDAAKRAVLNAGLVVSAGPGGRAIKFKVSGSFLWCRLPSARVLCFPYPKIMPVMAPWGELKDALTYMTVPSPDAKLVDDPQNTSKWARVSTYGGKLVENVTQAICRDLLAYAIVNAEAAGYPVVLHVHDEVVSEMPKGKGDLKEFESVCARTPEWAAGLPVTTAGWRGERYRKG